MSEFLPKVELKLDAQNLPSKPEDVTLVLDGLEGDINMRIKTIKDIKELNADQQKNLDTQLTTIQNALKELAALRVAIKAPNADLAETLQKLKSQVDRVNTALDAIRQTVQRTNEDVAAIVAPATGLEATPDTSKATEAIATMAKKLEALNPKDAAEAEAMLPEAVNAIQTLLDMVDALAQDPAMAAKKQKLAELSVDLAGYKQELEGSLDQLDAGTPFAVVASGLEALKSQAGNTLKLLQALLGDAAPTQPAVTPVQQPANIPAPQPEPVPANQPLNQWDKGFIPGILGQFGIKVGEDEKAQPAPSDSVAAAAVRQIAAGSDSGTTQPPAPETTPASSPEVKTEDVQQFLKEATDAMQPSLTANLKKAYTDLVKTIKSKSAEKDPAYMQLEKDLRAENVISFVENDPRIDKVIQQSVDHLSKLIIKDLKTLNLPDLNAGAQKGLDGVKAAVRDSLRSNTQLHTSFKNLNFASPLLLGIRERGDYTKLINTDHILSDAINALDATIGKATPVQPETTPELSKPKLKMQTELLGLQLSINGQKRSLSTAEIQTLLPILAQIKSADDHRKNPVIAKPVYDFVQTTLRIPEAPESGTGVNPEHKNAVSALLQIAFNQNALQ